MSIIWQDIKALCRRSWRKLKLLRREDRAGLYITVIFHLTVIIVLAITQISTIVLDEKSFVFDFSRQEEEEARLEEEAFREDISRQIDEMIRMASTPAYEDEEIRNVAVDAGAEEKSEEAENPGSGNLQSDLSQETEDARDEAVDIEPREPVRKEDSNKSYKGPSVVSYTLTGRKASHLSIPAYRCMGGGEVTVAIVVNNAGKVVRAQVIDEVSADDQCLRKFAERAARLSLFTPSGSAPSRQSGQIVYRFVAQ